MGKATKVPECPAGRDGMCLMSERIGKFEAHLTTQGEQIDCIYKKLVGTNQTPGWGVRLDRLERSARNVTRLFWIAVVSLVSWVVKCLFKS